MSARLTAQELIRQGLTTPSDGVVGLVDVLLDVARQQPVQLAWQAGDCCVCLGDGNTSGCLKVPLRKSVVRAALARVAVLCNQNEVHSVSPYGGQGEVLARAEPAIVIRVEFVNTPDQQTLQLAPMPMNGAGAHLAQ